MDELKAKLCKNEGPKVQATQPDYVKFHDDKVALSVLTIFSAFTHLQSS